MRSFLALIFICLLSNTLKSQDCLSSLYRANKLLDAGRAKECMDLITPCSKKINPISVRWQAYRLMSIAYILLGQTDSAKVVAESMLDINPTYKPNLLRDPKDFINLLNSVVVIPKFTLGLAVSVGTNTTFASVPKSYAVADYKKTYSTSNYSFQLGTNFGIYLNPKLAIEFGVYATGKQYSIDYNFSNWKVYIKERLTYLDVPLTCKYVFSNLGRTRLFIQGGAFAGYLLYSANDFYSNFNSSQQVNKLSNLNSLDRRNKLNYGFTAGLGMFYKVRNGHLSLQANYFGSLRQINQASQRYAYTEQMFTYFYVDDDIILHNLAVSIGYSVNMNYKVYRKK
jgi:hypothetical protein